MSSAKKVLAALFPAEGRRDRVKIDALVDAGGEAGEHRPGGGGVAGRGGCDGVIGVAPERLGARIVNGGVHSSTALTSVSSMTRRRKASASVARGGIATTG
jgi:hypothetical protein